jgi:guanidinobutyrase
MTGAGARGALVWEAERMANQRAKGPPRSRPRPHGAGRHDAAADGCYNDAMDPAPLVRELALLLRPAGGGLYLVSTGKAEQQALQRRFYDAATDADVTAKFKATLARVADAKVVVLGIPSDVGAGFRRGANLGPQAIREQLLRDEPDWPEQCAARGIVDIGDVFVVPQLLDDDMLSDAQIARSRKALYPDAPELALPVSPLSIAVRALSLVAQINPRAKPMVLGGDHSVAWPVVKALHDSGKRFCIVHPDAHTDLLPERLGVTQCFATWAFHANEMIGKQERLLQVGIRATRFPKEHWESTLGVRQWWAKDVLADPARALDEIIAAAKKTGLPAYLSNDVDGTDASIADATGTPEPGGLTEEFMRTLIARLGAEVGLVGADLVEVAPILGARGGERTLALASRYVRDSLDALGAPAINSRS